MFNSQKKGVKTEEISGLALALVLDRCFIDLFDLWESDNKPLRRFRPQQSLPAKKQVARVAGKEVFLSRF
ncbi:hypothetical protein Psch_01343 [Pelotomaculum schinkii]|uniref:Uncharacterized protein n=1 Tax=Pelotomaculum schinkii TaxID=78350 RepID=A0A4Y7RFK8_9FIRM|nr:MULTISPECIES: hypothetical protein [Pelotomaculum]TEB07788.1 hypothetical protein Psch_01343 [Pelotomaculum schinkii]TEB16041.1 hypothetical protein Psfp_01639 [Pelotomaculum sp. FP]